MLQQLRELAPWHLDVEVAHGVRTRDAAVLDEAATGKVHLVDGRPGFQNLLKMIYPDGLEGRSLLDVACNCGGYCFWAKEIGAGRCFGFDVREHWIRQARFLAQHRERPADDIYFQVLDLYDLATGENERFDISIFKGIFYHLPDPMNALKIVADRTRELMLVNTATRSGHPDGYLAVGDEPKEALMSGIYGLSWYPTGPEVLGRILEWVGFPEFRVVYWLEQTELRGGGGPLGRIELVAAREAGTFHRFDQARLAQTERS